MRTVRGLAFCVIAVAGCDSGNLQAYASAFDGGAFDALPPPVGADGGGASEIADYLWGNVRVSVVDTAAIVVDLRLQVTDQASPAALSTSLEYPPATTVVYPTNGALVIAHYGCYAPGLYWVGLNSCGDGMEAVPGCLTLQLSAAGVTGSFVHPTGVRCDVRSASAAVEMPLPPWSLPGDAGASGSAATGTFTLDCMDSDGTHLVLDGRFALPVQTYALLC